MNQKIRVIVFVIIVFLFSLPTKNLQSNNLLTKTEHSLYKKEKVLINEILESFLQDSTNMYEDQESINGDGYWGLRNGSIINYNCVCIFDKDRYWE